MKSSNTMFHLRECRNGRERIRRYVLLMSFPRSLLVALIFIMRCDLVFAAQIREIEGNLTPTIEISGEIKRGDLETLASIAVKAKGLHKVILSSPGGDVVEAIRIGELIRALRLLTLVDGRGPCASACFFIWINGQYRSSWWGKGLIGLHRPYLKVIDNDDKSIAKQSFLMNYVRIYLEDRQIPRRIIDLMMGLSSSQIYWMSNRDIEEIGDGPFELQELYISKCGPSVDYKYKEDEFEAWQERVALRVQCIDQLNEQARRPVLQRLMNGWLPPDPVFGN